MKDFVTNKTIEKLKYDLVREGHITYEDLSKAEELSKIEQANIGQILVNLNLIKEETLLGFVETKLHIPYVNLDEYNLDENCIKLISKEDSLKYLVMPLFKIENTLTVAMADPLDLFVLNDIIRSVNFDIEPIICSSRNILQAIEKYHGKEDDSLDITSSQTIDWRKELLGEKHDEEQITKVIKAILYQAVQEKTHEISFEQSVTGLAIKFKSNGKFSEKGNIPILLTPMFLISLKKMSNMDITIQELPQVGKLKLAIEGINLTVSVASFPTVNGERITIKIYKTPQKIQELPISDEKLTFLKNCCQKSGIILVCGDNLSGKTSVVYSLLSSINNINKNIMTLESIVKYDISNVNQCELREKVGFDLEKAAKFIEFQSPDIIYFESITSKPVLEYFGMLAMSEKLVITEFLTNSLESLIEKFKSTEFDLMKNLLLSVVFVHSKDKIEVFDKKQLEAYINR